MRRILAAALSNSWMGTEQHLDLNIDLTRSAVVKPEEKFICRTNLLSLTLKAQRK